MRFFGDFRSIDTTADPNGQKYRVLLFTGYDGRNPYPTYTYLIPQHAAPITIPATGFQMTMATKPFTVNYEGDSENIYKPYRCSTATVSFMETKFDTELLNATGTNTLVILLKWNNDVSEVNGRMYNSTTGETLSKTEVYHNDTGVRADDYNPYEYDRFCYNVEWIGFSTPETFSMDYSHVTDTFTLNAQDALSTLQYSKYTWIGDEQNTVVPFSDILLEFCKGLGTYRKVYVTDTVKFPDVSSLLTNVYWQQNNNFDEDDKPTDKLTVLTQILTYLNLTAIPYKNDLIITSPNAIAEGWHNYFTYALPFNGYIMNWPKESAEYTAQPQEQLSDEYAIDETSYADGGTTISTSNIYNSVKADVDEYAVDLMLPDITDNNLFNYHYYDFSHDYFFRDGTTRVYWCWEHDFWHVKSEYLQTFQYNGTASDYNAWYTTEVEGNPNYGLSAMQWKPTSAIVDDGGVKMEQYSTVAQSPYNPTRKIYFYNPNFTSSWAVVGRSEVDSRFQTMLYTKTKPVVLCGSQYLQITGSWVFYASNVAIFHTMPTTQYINDYVNLDVDFSTQWAYLRAKVKCCGQWLKNTSSGYGWQDTETDVKLYYQTRTGKAHGVQTDFQRTFRNFDGIVVELPVTGDTAIVGAIEMWISRPLGCGTITSSCATLTNFAINVVPSNVINATGTKIDEVTNTEYKTEIDPNNIEQYTVDALRLSSDSTKGARFSQTIRNGYKTMPKIYNVATGNYSLAEQHITNNIANQYSTPTINLQMTLHNTLTPYTCITWGKMPNKKFVMDSAEIDFEYERQNITITEVKAPNTLTTTKENTTRNYRRNSDLLFHDNKLTERNTTVLSNDAITINGTFSGATGSVIYTGDEPETGCITLQPNFTDATMQLSVPNDMLNNIFFTVNGNELVVTTT